ncbi:hypothetical protein WR25_15128 [Diploscapter pachys]|uniref:Uncharacterized protein n=1 Tax=Diploscapter pachys TaxID=2018661 RepID=A0A2A2LM73_9BILA|nr:hypothetical protein WR25_15128 [Diploscapter pachys]
MHEIHVKTERKSGENSEKLMEKLGKGEEGKGEGNGGEIERSRAERRNPKMSHHKAHSAESEMKTPTARQEKGNRPRDGWMGTLDSKDRRVTELLQEKNKVAFPEETR